MRNTIKWIDTTNPLIDPAGGFVTDQFRLFILQVTQRGLLIGIGSPEGTIEAQQGVEYMDENGLAGAVKWIKQKADIGGDRTLGWTAIG